MYLCQIFLVFFIDRIKENAPPILYQEVIPAPKAFQGDNDMVVEANPIYDSVSEDKNFTPPPPVPKQTPLVDPDDPENLYSLVTN